MEYNNAVYQVEEIPLIRVWLSLAKEKQCNGPKALNWRRGKNTHIKNSIRGIDILRYNQITHSSLIKSPHLDDKRHNPGENSNNTTRRTHARSRALERHARGAGLHATSRSSTRSSISSASVATSRSSHRSRRSSHRGTVGDSPSLNEPVAEPSASASVVSALRVVLASRIEVSAPADSESGCAVAVRAVRALPAVRADLTKTQRTNGGGDGGLAGGLAACCAGDDGGGLCG